MSNTSAIPSSSLGSSQALPAGNPSNALNRISARDLTEAQIRMLSASQCLHLTDQLDQELLSLMQSLDGHFLRATGIITEKILPNVEKYGENSRDIWEAVKVGPDIETRFYPWLISRAGQTVLQDFLRGRRWYPLDGPDCTT